VRPVLPTDASVQNFKTPRNAMSATPRLRSGFPATPATAARRRPDYEDDESPSISSFSSIAGSTRQAKLPLAPENAVTRRSTGTAPVIPLTLLDGPQQRLYAFAVYILLWAWKLYDWLQVVEDGDASWWLFLKWILIDFVFLFGLPELRIPWLELSQLVVTACFASHLVTNYMLMFNIPVRHIVYAVGFWYL
jgi:nucleoporin POM152